MYSLHICHSRYVVSRIEWQKCSVTNISHGTTHYISVTRCMSHMSLFTTYLSRMNVWVREAQMSLESCLTCHYISVWDMSHINESYDEWSMNRGTCFYMTCETWIVTHVSYKRVMWHAQWHVRHESFIYVSIHVSHVTIRICLRHVAYKRVIWRVKHKSWDMSLNNMWDMNHSYMCRFMSHMSLFRHD